MSNSINTDKDYFSEEKGFFTHVVDNRDEKYDIHLHSHTFFEFVYIVSGSSKHKWQGAVSVVSAGDLLLIAPGETHCFVRDKSTLCCHRDILFSKERVLKCFSDLSIDFEEQFFSKPFLKATKLSNAQQNILNYYINFLVNHNKSDKNFIQSTIYALLTNLLWNFYSPELTERKLHRPYYLEYIFSIIDSRKAFNMTIEEICKRTFRSQEHVCREFKKYTGKTISETVREAKLEYSAKLLRETTMNIKDILDEISVNSHSYFTNQFKLRYRLTPKDYRKENSIV